MHILKAALLYFALVLGTGFVLGVIRVPLIVPRIGERYAELLEMPFMLVVIVLAAALQGRTIGAYIASRDPVSGSVYLAMLLLFALMPALVQDGGSHRQDDKLTSRPPT